MVHEQRPFRLHHLFCFLEAYSLEKTPLDLALHHYFRQNKSLGSKDRAFLAETVYGMIRWLSTLDALSSSSSWESRFEAYETLPTCDLSSLSPHLQVGFPKGLYDLLSNAYGEEKAKTLCLASNEPAPTTVRVNLLKTTREALFDRWKALYPVELCTQSLSGIRFKRRLNLFELPEFKEGLFEMQDEASQKVAALVAATPGQSVLDYCAGSGGKTLAFAPNLGKKGQIYLHDIRAFALQEAKKRLKRAGIQNAQIVLPDSPVLAKLKNKMDWVLVDAPCSGTGTLRRNPDMKWRFSEELLERLIGQQRVIFERALSFVKPGNSIVYATCSILKEENTDQLRHFMRTYGLTLAQEPFQSFPTPGEMDGFFAAVLIKPQHPHCG